MLSIGINIVSCGEKKETDAMGNPINQAETSVNQTPKELGKELFLPIYICIKSIFLPSVNFETNVVSFILSIDSNFCSKYPIR